MAWDELVGRRTQTAKHWRDTTQPSRAYFEQVLKTVLHYPSAGPDSAVFDSNVDLSPQRVINAQLDGWRITVNGWHYALGKPGDKPTDGWVGFGGRQGAHWVKFRLVRAGYLHYPTRGWEDLGGSPTYNRANLSASTESITVGPTGFEQIINVGSEALWSGIFPGVSAKWRMDGLQLKEEIYLSQSTREAMPAPSTPASQTYFGFVFQLDVSDIPKWVKNSIQQDIESDFDDSNGEIELRDALDRLLAFMPIDFAYSDPYMISEGGEDTAVTVRDRVTMRKRFWKDPDGSHYLLIGAPVLEVLAMHTGGITFDPSFSSQPDETSSQDTYLWSNNATTNYGTDTTILTKPAVKHVLISFDVSSIPSSATCNTAVLSLWSAESASAKWFEIYSLITAVSDWVEGEATWNDYKSSTAWPGSGGASTSGTDYEADATPPAITFPESSIDTEAQADLTAGANLTTTRIEGWFGSPNTNYGLLIGVIAESVVTRVWHSSGASANYRPKLAITYTEGDVTVTPTPASAATAVAGPVTIIEPDPATAVVTVAGPTIVFGSVSVEPTPVSGAAVTYDPIIELSSITITPATANAAAASVDPTVSTSVIADPASASAVGVDPTVVQSSVTAIPTPASSAVTGIDPTVLVNVPESTDIVLEQVNIGSTTSGTSIILSSWTPTTNELILVAIALRDETVSPSVSGNGLTWVEVADVDNIQNQCGINLFRAMGSPSAGQITVSLPGNSKPVMVVALRFSGTYLIGSDGGGAVETVATNQGPTSDNSNMKTAVVVQTNSAWAVGFGTHRRKTLTVPSGETVISINNKVGGSGDQTSLSVWYELVSTAATTVIGANGDLNAAVDWAMIAISIKPGVGSPSPEPGPASAAVSTSGPTILTTGTQTVTPIPASTAVSTVMPLVVIPIPTLTSFAVSPTIEIWLADPFGNRLAFVDTIISFSAARLVNGMGAFRLVLPDSFDDRLAQLDGMVEIWRSPYVAGALRLEMVGFVRKLSFEESSEGVRRLILSGPDQVELLSRRVIAYDAGTSQAKKTNQIDDMMKDIVRENLGSSAGSGRDLSALNFSVQADTTLGSSVTRAFSRKNVLEACRDLADLAYQQGTPIYFDVVPRVISSSKIGFEFRTYAGQRGAVRTYDNDNPLLFESGVTSESSLTYDYEGEVNYIYAGGGGSGEDRLVIAASDTARIGDSPWNRREGFADARNEGDDTSGVTSVAEEKLQQGRPYVRFSGILKDTPQSRYGVDWDFGDQIAFTFVDRQFNAQVSAVRFEVNEEGDQTIESKFEVVS